VAHVGRQPPGNFAPAASTTGTHAKRRIALPTEGQKSMRAAMLSAAAVAMTTQVLAQDVGGDIAAGRRIADQWCSTCHQIDAASSGRLAPTFPKVANLPSTTALSLKVFLRTSHETMPNVQLTQSETNAVVAYILSLKGK